MRIAAIDQGTTSTRVLVVDTLADITGGGAICLDASPYAIEHQQHYPQQGRVEHNPQELLDNIKRCLDAAGNIDAIGISNQGESCLAWDAVTRQPLSPVIVWQDNRTQAQVEQLKSDGFEDTTLALAGLPLDSYFSASKLGWLLKNIPEVKSAYARGSLRLGTTDAFFLDRLTGRYVTDLTTASRTSLMNLQTGQWDSELCERFGVPVETLPEIVSTTGDFGSVDTAQGPVPLIASIVDQQAALYGFGCRQSGDVKITFGTGAFALTVTGSEIYRRPGQGLLPTVAWQKDGEKPVYALDGGIYTASAALNWARSLGLFQNFDAINHFQKPSALERGLVFVPALSGLACPHWDRNARGNWLGMALDHTSDDLVQAIIEGVACRAAEVIEAMSSCVPLPGAIGIDGGMSINPYFTQFLADVLGREVRPSQLAELTAWGSANLVADTLSVDLPAPSGFDSVEPATDRREALVQFRRAVDFSRQWGTPG